MKLQISHVKEKGHAMTRRRWCRLNVAAR